MNGNDIRDAMVRDLGCSYAEAGRAMQTIAGVIRVSLKKTGRFRMQLLGEFRVIRTLSKGGVVPHNFPDGKFVPRGFTGYIRNERYVTNVSMRAAIIKKPRNYVKFRPHRSMLEHLSRGEIDDRAKLMELIDESGE